MLSTDMTHTRSLTSSHTTHTVMSHTVMTHMSDMTVNPYNYDSPTTRALGWSWVNRGQGTLLHAVPGRGSLADCAPWSGPASSRLY